MERQELLAHLEKFAAAGDEKAFESFVIEHFEEFPEEVQGKLLFGFFSETVEKEAGNAAIAQLQQQGLEALDELAKIKEEASKTE